MKTGAAGTVSAHIRPAHGADLPALRDILNSEILTSTASWTTIPKTLSDMADWLAARRAGGYPVLIVQMPGETEVLGYGSYGPFRTGQGYVGTVEHSIYLSAKARGKGLAACLLDALVVRARRSGMRLMIGGVSSNAKASRRFHHKMGFDVVGRIPGAGRKFGEDLDLLLFARRL